jgi:hypothetical protein
MRSVAHWVSLAEAGFQSSVGLELFPGTFRSIFMCARRSLDYLEPYAAIGRD